MTALLEKITHRSRCGMCGTTEKPALTAVTDWRTDYLCDACVESVDLSDFTFDPIGNAYTRGDTDYAALMNGLRTPGRSRLS
jgi:hypothetical protein